MNTAYMLICLYHHTHICALIVVRCMGDDGRTTSATALAQDWGRERGMRDWKYVVTAYRLVACERDARGGCRCNWGDERRNNLGHRASPLG